MKHLRVLGIGSPYGDDQVGWRVAEKLEEAFSSSDVSIHVLDRPGPSLLHYLDGAYGAILVDALHASYAPGTIVSLTRRRLLREANQWSSHLLGVPEALALGEALDLLPENLVLLGIQSGNVDLQGNPLSPALDAALPEAVARIRAELRVWQAELQVEQSREAQPKASGGTSQAGG